jgi:xanthine/uracil permease
MIVFAWLPAMIVVFGGVALTGVYAVHGARVEFKDKYVTVAHSLGVTQEEGKAEFEHWYQFPPSIDSLMIPRC